MEEDNKSNLPEKWKPSALIRVARWLEITKKILANYILNKELLIFLLEIQIFLLIIFLGIFHLMKN